MEMDAGDTTGVHSHRSRVEWCAAD